jgi:glycosyltransferase involved in cell wall biosynthesis
VFRFNFFTGRFADHVITVSTNSQQDTVRFLKIPEQRVSVVLEGVGGHYRVIHDRSELREAKSRYGIPGRFVLYVGGFDHHKNLPTLVKAFALLRRQIEWREPLSLVFVGKLSSAAAAVQAEVAAQYLEESVIFTDYVSEDDAVRLFNAADVFALPSFYEGFGLPVLEAMACGTPVVCSNAASLPEVVGDAAIQCSPESPQEFCDAMQNVLTDQAFQNKLRQKGLARVQDFSWDNMARQTLEVYESVMRDNVIDH